MKNIKIRLVILLSAFLLAVLMITQIIIIYVLNQDNLKHQSEIDAYNQAAFLVKDTSTYIVQIQQFLTDVAATANPDGFQDAQKNADQAKIALQRLSQLIPQEQSQITAITNSLDELHEVGKKMANVYMQEGRAAGNLIMKDENGGFDAKSAQLVQKLDALTRHIETARQFDLSESHNIGSRNYDITMTFAVVLLITGVSTMLFLYMRIVPRLHRFTSLLKKIDHHMVFSEIQSFTILRHDEIGQAMLAFKNMMLNIDLAFSEINHTMSAVSKGDFHQKIEGHFKGDLEKLAQNMNQTIISLAHTIYDINEVMNAMAEGDLTKQVQTETQGELSILKENINKTISRTRQMMDITLNDIIEVMASVSHGIFTHQVNAQANGKLAQLKTHINLALETLKNTVSEINHVMEAVADGDLRRSIQIDTDGDLNLLKNNINQTIFSLEQILSQVLKNMNAMQHGIEELTQGYLDLANRTNEQATAVQQTAESIQLLTTSLSDAVNHSQDANVLAKQAAYNAQQGNDLMHAVNDKMNMIHSSASKIVDIITTIDSIAFQTNILAINAAVEAAHAGEEGRGFAVVAGEIRSLAHHSATAAREIKTLILDSMTQINEGSALVQSAKENIQDVVKNNQLVREIVKKLTESSLSQNQEVGQINRAVDNLDQITQHNAALATQSATAIESINDQSRNLLESLSLFKVRG